MTSREAAPSERDKLTKLIRFLEHDGIALGDNRRRFPAPDKQVPVLSQRVKTFYAEKWSAPSFSQTGRKCILVPQGRLIFNRFETSTAPERGSLLMPLTERLGPQTTSVIGGTPITIETAIELRMIVYGSCHHSFSREWQKSSLEFQHLEGHFPYGLNMHRCGSRALALCVQGFLIKHLLFGKEYQSTLFMSNALQPTSYERRRALISAMSEILWQAGERRRCCVCLLQDKDCFDPRPQYRPDKITERLHLFEFKKLEDLKIFIKRNLEQFQNDNGCGCILFLYSVVLSRTIHRIKDDLDMNEEKKVKLLSDMEECTQALVNLLLTGRAVPHLHNGDVIYTKRGTLLSRPIKGCKQRNEVGFLYWDKEEPEDNRTEVGSMLKTPKYPIWVTKVNGHFGLLFSMNIDLVSDWRAEHRFVMHYYTGLISQERPAQLTIDTRYNRPQPKLAVLRRGQDDKTPALEQCIMTKWYGANVLWNGLIPFY